MFIFTRSQPDEEQGGIIMEWFKMSSKSGSSLPVHSPCLFCHTISNHKNEVERILQKAMKNRPEIDIEEFRQVPICNIKTPIGEKPLCFNDVENMYTKNYPDWHKDFQCFPEGPIFYDKLFKKEPFSRGIDIENKLVDLRRKVNCTTKLPFDKDIDTDAIIIMKTVDDIMESLKDVISELKLDTNSRVKNGVPKVLTGKVKSKLHQLKDQAISMETVLELQNEALNLVIENDKKFRDEKGYYEMR